MTVPKASNSETLDSVMSYANPRRHVVAGSAGLAFWGVPPRARAAPAASAQPAPEEFRDARDPLRTTLRCETVASGQAAH
jgi:hypothetical protein